MNKRLVFMMIILVPGFATAQDFSWGAKAGLNLAKLKMSVGTISASSDDLVSFHAGLYGKIKTSEKFFIQPEFIYSAQGGKGDGGNFNMGYLNVPVMLAFEFSPGISVQAGPQVGFLMNASVDGTDIKSQMNSVDFGASFGFGVERPSGFSFSFRYNIGFTNTLSSAVASSLAGLGLGTVSMTNQVIQFSLGYRLSKSE
jgi:Outer membrane protein beta-barrel domain